MPTDYNNTSTWTTWATASTTSSGTAGTWVYWTTSAVTVGTATYGSGNNYAPPPETAEARQARESAERSRAAARVAAQKRAEDLLLSLLDENQRRELTEHNSISLFSELQKRYRIRRGRSGNVDELDGEGQVVARLCAHPSDAVPDADTMAAQLLMLTSAEAEFLRVANRTVVRM